ncbi:hypothetical protein J2Z83_003063 [Virgibacillus natechei]|uniref:DUF3784 domain-containing protein n=1 Tax=Virgibacillus natechei TaxID=1216297 RepID=A0ABS4IIZ0_9BACI|nr:hypothetical protein [Virgibacillus natechei]MBP1970927.1 hypothetical protein [Virgibacillus natechei]UZD13306.1 hypothetical protein OLD84_01690 [Virgibacillus natechei]
MLIIGALVLPFFIYALVMYFKFSRSDKSKDEKEQVLAYSSKHALGVFPIGWLILHLYHNFIASIPYDTYRDAMWVLVLLLFTVQGFAINYYKKRMQQSDASQE